MQTLNLIALSDGLYLDAFVQDEHDEVIFLSLWARDGDMQHFFAALTLPITQGGYRERTVNQPNGQSHTLHLNRVSDMKKMTTRLPKYTPVGEWVHTWLMLPALTKTPHGSQEAWLISPTALDWNALWPTVKNLCHLPLLDSWQPYLAPLLGNAPMVNTLTAWGLHAYHLHFEPEVIEPLIADAVKTKTLPLTLVQ